jgi:ASC-1-like (ASCH) protein
MLHVAVLLKPYLDLLLSGKKTIECRLTIQARDPYERIEAGERIYFKQSAGPYGATAVAEHVIFEDALTPRRIGELRRDYNDRICGDDSFWELKRNSNFCTLIWLKEVEAVDQGVAWMVLDDETAWRRMGAGRRQLLCAGDGAKPQAAAGQSFLVEITDGNLRNNSLYVSRVADRFPKWCFGGAQKRDAGRPITLILHEGPTVQTDIVAPRHMLRTRVWGRWFQTHGAQRGDHVVFTPVDEATYFVGLARVGKSR